MTSATQENSVLPALTSPTSAATRPVVAGFHPDPSICRVGTDYYLANSSFEYFPAVPVWHSTDLITWDLIGNALDRPEQFEPGHARASGGIYAPTLRQHGGRYWLITTDTSGPRGQVLAHADHPAGPWSVPRLLPELAGIDPDLAWDADGTCYVTYCSSDPGVPGIAQARIDAGTGTVLEAPRTVWTGTGLAHPEAPHLYRRGAWWYLMIAEGGTERGHGVSIARGLSPEGPFEPAPHNPVFSHRSTTHPVQNTGHADLVERADGSWAAVYLGVRPSGRTPMFHVNGRETFVAGVRWRDDWPVFDEEAFDAPRADHSFADDFSGPALHPRWVSPGAAPGDLLTGSRDGGSATLRPEPAPTAHGPSGVLTRVQDARWSFEADVDITGGDVALRVHLDDRHAYELTTAGSAVQLVAQLGTVRVPVGDPIACPAGATLVVEAVDGTRGGPDDLVFSVRTASSRTTAGRLDGRYLSTEVAGGFTGRTVGLRATAGLPRVGQVRYTSR